MTQLSCNKLASLIAKRHACLVQLRDLGKRQSELIATSEMGPLLRLLSAKHQLIAVLQAIENELTPFHAQDPERRSWPSKEARASCADQAAECRQLLDEIMRMERQNEQEMTVRRDQVATQLETAHVASQARGAYQAQQMTTLQGPHAGRTTIAPIRQAAPTENQLDIHSDA